MEYIEISETIFSGKQNIPWKDVEVYLHKYDGLIFENIKYGDKIRINTTFADEYVHSQYTRKLRGGLAKVKANMAQIIPQLVAKATNRRWVENKDDKHQESAIGGWHRYDTYFCMKVKSPEDDAYRFNYYVATLIVRLNDTGAYLYDIINIKKEARKPMDS